MVENHSLLWIQIFICLANIYKTSGLGSNILYEESSHAPNIGLDHHLPLYIDNFKLKSIVVHHLPPQEGENHRIVRHISPTSDFDMEYESESRHLLEISEMSERNRVILFAKMCMAVYPVSEAELGSWGSKVFNAGDGRYYPSDSVSESTIRQEIFENITSSLNFRGQWSIGINPDHDTIDSSACGIVMGEFQSMNETVIVFRGSVGFCDNHNINGWMRNWFLNEMGPIYMEVWENAGLEVTSTMENNFNADDTWYRFMLRYGSNKFTKTQFPKYLQSAGADLSVDQIRQTGYWELTKEMIRQVLPSERNVAEEGNVYLTGHSQGGSRAQVASMWLEKEDDMAYPTYTFAAPGSQCFTRSTAYHGNFLDDVDPYKNHSQVVNYVNILDPYGQMDYDIGKACTYMTTDLANSMSAKYCEGIVGYSGATLLLSNDYKPTLFDDFSACRYWTHSIWSYVADLLDETYLYEDGSTDGGCVNLAIIPESDPEELCPYSAPLTAMENFWIAWLILVPIILCSCCGCCICLLVRRRRRRKNVSVAATGDQVMV